MKKFYLLMAAAAAFTLNAQEVKEGVINVGDYDNPSTVMEGSYFDQAPMTFYVAHTGAQIIYTADDLSDFSGKSNININKISYKFLNEGAYDDIDRSVKLYLMETDATAFEVIDGVKQYINWDENSPVVSFDETYSLIDSYGDEGEIVFDLSNAPFAINPGKGLLVVTVFDGDDCTGSSFDLMFYSSGIRSRAMSYTDNYDSFLTYKAGNDFPKASATYSGAGTNIDMPVTKIEYTYTEQTSTGIEDLNMNTVTDGAYYNMQGQRMNGNNLPAGIYIHHGKKVVIK